MAQVPYNNGVASVTPDTKAPDDYQHIQADASSFGGLIGQGVEKLGQGLERTSNNLFEISAFRDKVDSDDQVNKYIARHNAVLYGDPTKSTLGSDGKPVPDTGFYGLQGRDASDQRETTLQALNAAREEGRKNLKSENAKLEYDQQTRRIYSDAEGRIGLHADQQWKSWAGNVNKSAADLAIGHIGRHALDPDAEEIQHGFSDLINARVKEAQIAHGDDPTMTQAAIVQARAEGIRAWTETLSVHDPEKAMRILEKNKDDAGKYYEPLANQFRARANDQIGRTTGSAYFAMANQRQASQVANAPPPPAEAAKTLLRNFEGFKPTAYWDVNHWRVGYGSDTVTKPDGTIVPVTQGMQVTQEDAERDLARRSAETATKVQGQIGKSTWDALNPQAQAALTSTAYNYGSLPGSVVTAAQSGNAEALSKAVLDLRTDNGGVNSQRRETEAGIISGRTGAAIKADAFRLALDDKNLTPEQLHSTLRHITELVNAQEVAENQNTRARAERVNQSIGAYTTRFWDMLHSPNPDWVKFMGEINHDPALADAGPAKDGLMERVIKRSGEEQSLAFGPGYLDIKGRILSNPGTPGHIGDIVDIYKLPLGQLTAAGEHELVQIAAAIKKGPDEYGTQKTRMSLENYAKTVMAKTQLIPGLGSISTNKKGEEIFEAEFIPQFNAAYANWVKEGKDPSQFLNRKNVDEMIDRIYPKRKRDADYLASTDANLPETPNSPLPPPPDRSELSQDLPAVIPAQWDAVMKKTPMMATGAPLAHTLWANKLALLLKNPTPENMDAWDHSRLGHAAGRASDLIKQLTGKDLGREAEPAQTENLKAADDALNLTPQEKDLYRRHLQNLTGVGGVDNPDGSRSTLYQSVQEHDGKFYNIPTVWDGKRETQKWTDPSGKVWDVPNPTALRNVERVGWDKFPSYATAQEADARYEQMHKFMERDTAEHLGRRPKSYSIHDTEGPGPAGYLGDFVRGVVPEAAQKYVQPMNTPAANPGAQ